VISLRGVTKRFGTQTVLNGVDFEVQDGETVALLGPSGTGKSVLLKHIIGLIKPDAGSIVVDGKDVSHLDRKALAEFRQSIGYVFQNGALFDSDNVFENVRLGIVDESKFKDLDYATERVTQVIKLVNLQPEVVLTKYPAELSGGMRKRVGIARAIAGNPKYLLYDEPTSGLDPVNADIIDGLVKRLDEELGVTSVMVTHDVRGAFRVANRLALLSEGKIVMQGTPREFLESKNPKVQEFLERDFDNPSFAA
jgi:phospholipid/cholesterol/gamma-HCH transport system ATP-binding protein